MTNSPKTPSTCCPTCNTSLRGIAGKPGSRLTCPGCGAQYHVAARETVLHLDRVPANEIVPPVAVEHPQLYSFWRAQKGWLIGLIVMTVLAPGAILIWALIAGVMYMNHVSEHPVVEVAEVAAASAAPVAAGPAAPRTSKLAMFSLLPGLALLMGGVAIVVMGDVIREEMLFLSTNEMAGSLVGIAAGVIPALLVLALATTARRRCVEREMGGRGLATSAALMSLLFLGGLGHTFYVGTDQMVRWRTIDTLASQQDSKTLRALETEIIRPASTGTRHQAARLLASHAPERAIGMLEDGKGGARRATLVGLLHSPHRELAVDAAKKIAAAEPNSRDGAIARRFFEKPQRHQRHARSHQQRERQQRNAHVEMSLRQAKAKHRR